MCVGLAVRGDNGNGWPVLVVDEMVVGVVGVGAPSGGVGTYMRDVVDVLGLRELRRVDSAGMGWAVKAETASVAAVVGHFCFSLSVACDGVAEASIVVEWLRASAVLRVPVEDHVEPSQVCGMHAIGNELTDRSYRDSVPEHVSDGHVIRPADGLVEETIFLERTVRREPDVAFPPEWLIRLKVLRHARAREPLRSGGPVREAFLWDAARTGWKVPGALVVRLTRSGLPGA